MAIPAMAAVAAGGALMNVGANVVGMMASQGDRNRAMSAFQDALRMIQEVGAPPDLSREIILEKFQQAGVLTPEAEQEINLGMSKVADITASEETKQAQLSALDLISQRARGGLSPEDRAALNQARTEVEQQSQGQQEQIMQEYQQRGMAGAGTELAARLSASQAGTSRMAEESDRLAAMAAQNALQAARESGSLGTQMRQQEFGEEETKARASDEIAKFNIQNAMARQERNVGARNVAEQQNIARQQKVSDVNVEALNLEKRRQKEAEEREYQLALQRAGMLSGASQQLGGAYGQKAAATAEGWKNIGSGFGEMGKSMGGAMPGGGK